MVFGTRHRAAGLHAAVHRRPAAARSRSSTTQVPEAVAYTAISGFPTVVDGNAVLRLKPWEERKRKQQQIADELRPKLAQIPGAIAFAINPPSLGQSFRSTPIEYVVMSQVPYPELQRIIDSFLDEARKYPVIHNLQTDLRLNTPEVRVNIKRDKLSDIGVPVDTRRPHARDRCSAAGRSRASSSDGEQYDVIVQAAPIDRTTPADISDAYVRARDGSMVQLVQPGRRARRRGAAVAQPLQPAARGQDHRHARARLLDRRRR